MSEVPTLMELFDGFCQAFTDKDVPKVMRLFADDASMVAPGLSISGKQEIRKFFESEAPKIEDYRIEKKSVIEKGNEIAVEWHVRHKTKPTGKQIDVNGVTLITAEGGLIKKLRDYADFPAP